jgi:RimJ/RimL family protein N-acetyltransferase
VSTPLAVSGTVGLVDVDETVLAEMIDAAMQDAAPDEVTPPLDDSGTWSEARQNWMRELHRDRRAGVDGPAGEATWAICVDGHVVGATRLKRTGDGSVLETGIWLTRAARGQGVGVAAIQAVVAKAAELGASAVYAETTLANVRAQGLLRRLGFALSRGPKPDEVRALLRLP